jgi:pimeloyl-ACP methyl ester carboxylesterase
MYADPGSLSDAQVQRHHDLLRREGNRDATLRRVRTAIPPDPATPASVAVPALILWGARDRWVPVADARRLHRDIPGSTLLIYDNAGHAPMEEIPDRSAADLRRFLLK